MTAYLQESLSGVRVVRSFAQEERHVARMGELNELNRQANLKTVYLNASYFPAVELLSALGTAVILLYGGYQALDLSTEAARQAQIGILVAFVGYLTTFFDPIQQLSNLYTTYQQGMAALDKIFDLLDTAPDMVDKPDAADPGTLRGEIEMDHVWFSYGLDQAAGLKRSSGKIEDARARDRATRDARGSRSRMTGRSRTCRSTSRPGRRWRWSARRAPGSRRSPSWSRVSMTRSGGGCWWMEPTCEICGRAAYGASWGSCPRRGSCSRGRCARTSPSATRRERGGGRGGRGCDRGRRFHQAPTGRVRGGGG